MTSSSRGVFPFGRPVQACPPSASDHRRVVVVGAYPSALHVSWTPPEPYRRIQAIAVENEPEPFWTGNDQAAKVEAWKKAVGFDPERWGTISPAGALNGSSGGWVDENVLTPLGITRADAWITDSLDTYRCSEDLAARLADTYNPFAKNAGLSEAILLEHPSENDIVREALQDHQPRLRDEFAAAAPDLIVTLGNAALAVVRDLLPRSGGADTRRLSASEQYGSVVRVRLGQRDVDLLPLAHPAAPAVYQEAHKRWR
ncbi:MAG TPA: uracil-DNA glycosylase family protein, partial [Gemmatimonadaceae bacterium]|nr:uracil-DNA glycosylase family protein [Gemmatimonadaceae bacterium]